jgi:hypothetical protein
MGVYGFHESTLLGKKIETPTEEEIVENIEFLWILNPATHNITLSKSTEGYKIFMFSFLNFLKYNYVFFSWQSKSLPGGFKPWPLCLAACFFRLCFLVKLEPHT